MKIKAEDFTGQIGANVNVTFDREGHGHVGFGVGNAGIYVDGVEHESMVEEFVMFANQLIEQPDKFHAFVEYWDLQEMDIDEAIDLFDARKRQKATVLKMFKNGVNENEV